jgi:hypothetical protein
MHWNAAPTPQLALCPDWQVPWPSVLTQHVLVVRSQGADVLQYGTPASLKGIPLLTRSFGERPPSADVVPLDPELPAPEVPLDPELRPPELPLDPDVPLDPEPVALELDPELLPDASSAPSLASSEVPKPPLLGELHAKRTRAASDGASHPAAYGPRPGVERAVIEPLFEIRGRRAG